MISISRSRLTSLALPLFLLSGCCGENSAPQASQAAAPEEPQGPPNILLIINDQHSPRALGIAGNEIVKTPRLDQLGAQGAYFSQAYCNDPICIPSRYSMMSGRYPTEIGVVDNSHGPREGVRYLADYLSDRGYFTGSSGKTHFIPEDATHGFQDLYRHSFYIGHPWSHYRPWYLRRFKELGLTGDPFLWKMTKNWYWEVGDENNGLCTINPLPAEISPEHWITEMALRLIDRAVEQKKPFFVHASYFAPHHPYGPLKEFYDLYEGVEMPLPESLSQRRGKNRPFTDEEHRIIMRHYYGFVSQVDHYIGALLDGLEERGLADNTLVIMVSDHGDLMGEHGIIGKGLPYESSIGIPFFMRWPGHIPEGRVVSEPVSLLDILPTVFDAMGEPAPEVAQGQSVLPLAEGTIETLDREVYSVDVRHDPYMFVTVRTPRWKLIRWGARPARTELQLFDILADPEELVDLARDPEHAELKWQLAAKAAEFWETQAPFASRPFPKPHKHKVLTPPLLERDRE